MNKSAKSILICLEAYHWRELSFCHGAAPGCYVCFFAFCDGAKDVLPPKP
jgi:hypothetical protein